MCDGIVVADFSSFENSIPFSLPEVKSDYSGYVGFFTAIDNHGSPVAEYDEKLLRNRALTYSKQKCAPRKIFYPDIRLSIIEYSKGKKVQELQRENGGKVLTQITFYFEDTGSVQAHYPISHDKINGEAHFFHKNGTLEYKQAYKDGLREDCVSSVYESRKPHIKTCFQKGLFSGEFVELYENGTEAKKTSYVNGAPHGAYVENYILGEPKVRATFKNGMRDGPYKEFFQSGKILIDANYIDGLLIGNAYRYFEDGKIQEEYKTANNAAGQFHRYFENGNEEATSPLFKGLFHGEYIERDIEGRIFKRINYKSGILDGKSTTFFQNGVEQEVATYRGGQRVGYQKSYLHGGLEQRGLFDSKSGMLVSLNTYDVYGALDSNYPVKNDTLEGTAKKFYRNGSIAAITEYRAGKIQNPVKGFYPTGRQAYLANFDDNGTLIGALIYGKDGKTITSYIQKKESDLTQQDFYPDGSVKLLSSTGIDGNEKRYFYHQGVTTNAAMFQEFDAKIGLKAIFTTGPSSNMGCISNEDDKKFVCGLVENKKGTVVPLDTDLVLTALKKAIDDNDFRKTKIASLIEPEDPDSIFSLSNAEIINAAYTKGQSKGEYCYDFGFTKHCE